MAACPIYVSTPKGFKMPALGYGTWQSNSKELEEALETAISAGYRHIDTAAIYRNEHIIGEVLKRTIESGKATRDDFFIVTKLPIYSNRPADVEPCLNKQLEDLQLSCVDLYLIHCPLAMLTTDFNDPSTWKPDMTTDLEAIWQEMEKMVDLGKTKAIGVSNFSNSQVERILKIARIPPVTNQVELHLYFQQPELVDFHMKNGVTVTAYSPLGTNATQKALNSFGREVVLPKLLENQKVLEVAKKHGKTPAQVLLRHIIQKGIATIPKSTTPGRVRENFNIFDFELDSQDMEELNAENRNHRFINFSDFFPGIDKHPEYSFL